MVQKVRVEYGRKSTEDFNSTSILGAWEVDISDDDDLYETFDALYGDLKKKIDKLIGTQAPQVAAQPAPTVMPGETIKSADPQMQKVLDMTGGTLVDTEEYNDNPATLADIKDGSPVAYKRCKVFWVRDGQLPTGKRKVMVRIGNGEIPGQYVTMQTFDEQMMRHLKALQKDDFIDVKGFFKPWKGNENRESPVFDLVPQEVNRSSASA